MGDKLKSLNGRAKARVAGVVGVVSFFAIQAVASATVTLESKTIETPLSEYVGLIGAALVAIIVAAFGGMAIVALAKAGFKEAKSLIGRIA